MSSNPPDKVQIKLMPNGPILVEGNFSVQTADGTEMAEGKGKVFLCRCGASKTKPFCDGSHTQLGFQG